MILIHRVRSSSRCFSH